MGRKRILDRDAILDAAEAIVDSRGASGLTIDALAKAMGVTKGGIQYNFASKDELIRALRDRYSDRFDVVFLDLAGKDPSPDLLIRAYVEALRKTVPNARAAGLLVAMLQAPELLADSVREYRKLLDKLFEDTPRGRLRRVAFLAAEGVFFTRVSGMLNYKEDEIEDIYNDIAHLIGAVG